MLRDNCFVVTLLFLLLLFSDLIFPDSTKIPWLFPTFCQNSKILRLFANYKNFSHFPGFPGLVLLAAQYLKLVIYCGAILPSKEKAMEKITCE